MKRLLFSLIFLPVLSIMMLSGAAVAQFNPLEDACQGAQADSPACKDAADQNTKDPIAGEDGIIPKAADLLAIVAGVAAVIYIVLGGLAFITAGGDQQKIATARSRVFGGVIGLAVIALAWAIVSLVTKFILQT